MIKLIATDMDGTLLNSNHEIPTDFEETINTLNDRDIIFAISTGRNYLDISHKLKNYTDKLVFICENGASIHYKDKCIHSDFLPKESIKELVGIGRTIKNAYPMLCTPKGLYIESEEGVKLLNTLFPMDVPIIKVDSLLDVNEGVFKVNMFDTNTAETNSYPIFKSNNIENISLAVSGNYWLDMSKLGTHKGNAIKKVQQKFDIKYEETMVFGDYLNDLEMMKSAYHSYAMKNGHEKIKEVANFKTKYTNEEYGVTRTIKEIVIDTPSLAL